MKSLDLAATSGIRSRFMFQCYKETIEMEPKSLLLDSSERLWIKESQENNLLFFPDNAFDHLNRRVMVKILHNPSHIHHLTDNIDDIFRRHKKTLLHAERMLNGGNVSVHVIKNLYHSLVVLGSYRIVWGYPYNTLRKIIHDCFSSPRNPDPDWILGVFFVPDQPSYYSLIYLGLLHLAEKTLRNEKQAMKYFIDEYGFLSTRDLYKGPLENPQYVKRNLNVLFRIFGKDLRSIKEEKKRFQMKKNEAISTRHYYTDLLLGRYEELGGNRVFLMNLLRLAEFLVSYEERKHFWRAKTLLFFRRLAESFCLNPMLFTVEDLLNSCVTHKKEKQVE